MLNFYTTTEPELEAGIIAACLYEPKALPKSITAGIMPESFQNPAYKAVFAALIQMRRDGVPLDSLLEYEALRTHCGGEWPSVMQEIGKATSMFDCFNGFELWIPEFVEKWKVRQLSAVARETSALINTGYDARKAEAWLQERIAEIDKIGINAATTHGADIYSQISEEIANEASGKSIPGLSWGLLDVDNTCGRIRPTELVLIAARPGCGKSTMLRHLAVQCARELKIVVIFSLEMSAKEIVEEMAATISGQSRFGIAMDFDRNQRDYLNAVKKVTGQLEKLVYVRSPSSIEELASMVDTIAAEHPGKIGFFGTDYVQLLTSEAEKKNQTRNETLSQITRTLKMKAMQYGVPQIGLSQLSRDSEKQGRPPRLSDLRDSGSLEQDANRVIFLHHQCQDKQQRIITLQFIQEKFRGGPVGEVNLEWHRHTGRIWNHSGKTPNE